MNNNEFDLNRALLDVLYRTFTDDINLLTSDGFFPSKQGREDAKHARLDGSFSDGLQSFDIQRSVNQEGLIKDAS
ncbi:MAG: hypothetical protein WCO02_18800 [Bacteroidota bacterium]